MLGALFSFDDNRFLRGDDEKVLIEKTVTMLSQICVYPAAATLVKYCVKIFWWFREKYVEEVVELESWGFVTS